MAEKNCITIPQEPRPDKSKGRKEMINKLLTNTPTNNITGAKLVSDKIGIPQGNPNRNTKSKWKIRLEGQIKKLRQRVKVLGERKNTQEYIRRKNTKQNCRRV